MVVILTRHTNCNREFMPLALAARRQDKIGKFAHCALAAFLLADVLDGFEDGWHGVGRGRREPHGAEGFEIIDVVANVGDLIESKSILFCERGEHRQLVIYSLVDLRDRQLLATALDYGGLPPCV